MTDRRTTPDPARVDRSEPARVVVPVADLLAAPEGPRDRQVIFGEDVTILGLAGDHAYIRAEKDGYHGFLARKTLGEPRTATHRVSAPATHLYSEPDLKSPERMWLSFGSLLHATGYKGRFVETPDGFVPVQHVAPSDTLETDPLDVARRFLGTPYLWGGNSRAGIDCSGLVQAALLACGIPCPGDTDLQMQVLGQALPEGSSRHAGDLLFWKGHVAFVHDDRRLLHTNAFHMATAFEEIETALRRIDDQGDGPLLAHKRL
jgi:cell wall-associated NlpC family hydrolase